MRVAIGSDHRGFRMKHALIEYLRSRKHDVVDVGTFSEDSCNYAQYAFLAADAVRAKKAERGIIICKSGIGSAIAANKVKSVRAALAYNVKAARLSRLHNDSNVLVLGSDFSTVETAKKIAGVWLRTAFEGGRHNQRIETIKKIEEHHEKLTFKEN